MTKRMPFGRINDYVATLTSEQRRRTAYKLGQFVGTDATVKTWATREAMARDIRREELRKPRSDWSPLETRRH